jgi:Na+/H+-translocating membrane pyrophosphatase
MLPEEGLSITFNPSQGVYRAMRWELYGCLMLGLWVGLIIGIVTEFFTSHSYKPVRKLA